MQLGMNLSHWDPGTTALPFNNLALAGTGWFPDSLMPKGLPTFRATGPVPGPGYQLGTASWVYLRPGTYTITCPSRGQGVIRLNCVDVPGGCQDLAFTPAGESYQFDLKSLAPGFQVMSNPEPGDKTGMHDLVMLAPGGVAGQLFHPDYLAMQAPFKVCLRGMDVLTTNFAPNQDGPWPWINPPNPVGMGLAGMVELANMLGANLLVNIPYNWSSSAGATPDCAALGAYLNANYKVPGGTIWLEWSNEPWNSTFGTYNYILTQLASIIDPSTGQTLQAEGAWWSAGCVWLANAAFEAVAAAAPNITIKRVFSGAAANWGLFGHPFGGRIAEWGYKADAFAVAPYTGYPGATSGPYTTAALQALVNAGNMAGAIDLFIEGVQSALPTQAAALAGFQADCKAAGVKAFAYECGGINSGGGIWEPPNGLMALAEALTQAPQMGALTTQYLNTIAPYLDLACYYEDCRSGPFSARQNIDDVSDQISQALVAWAAANNG